MYYIKRICRVGINKSWHVSTRGSSCVFVCEIVLSLIVPGLHLGACPGRKKNEIRRRRGDSPGSALEVESSLAVEQVTTEDQYLNLYRRRYPES